MSGHAIDPTHTDTLSIHANPQKDQFGAIVAPIYQTSTFLFDNCDQGGARFGGKEAGYMYTRIGNPTNSALEGKIAKLEHAEACAATASGMGAIAASVWTFLKAGDHLISDDCLYGCTHALFEHQLRKFGVEVDFIDMAVPGNIEKHLKPNTRIVYFETPANPTLKVIDIEDAVKQARKQKDILVIVDNTFASPILTNPLDLGVDIVVHSATKYINGHTDVVAGLVCSRADIIAKVKSQGIKDITGAIISPHDAWLITRGTLTLDMRVKRAAENAQKVAEFLHEHKAVKKVYYPGLPDHPGHEIAKKQMKMFGSMIAFDVDGLEKAKKVLDNCHVVSLAVSLGGPESLIQHPASMTHAGVPKEEREAAGLTDNLIRLSVGCENVQDIIDDLKQALDLVL
ncbi:methionine gamma-lyase [Trichomonas vaginalis G3]|uniref:L-methionine gamma-lyase n=3 Tax=Trichomonas vaginalis TaxID=5722 RepID=A0A8U0WP13_TRIV3|nr:methionine gamma-lyase [Trichomonas vaginalis G3]EAX91132.1 methionine gamma-lyase [Trichomonas vaginalis G3]KAI5534867.1 methionine gamma-lyase [Trichomonas vaginalis G3]CAA04125.1 methionine gamma-lyase [Trichomonas vaginalis]|eukprot:XP_001304062.1 methionine gamma-lyase [Trichomonas vaginalis G3]